MPAEEYISILVRAHRTTTDGLWVNATPTDVSLTDEIGFEWTVTHKASGLAIGKGFSSYHRAMEFADRLGKGGKIDWTLPKHHLLNLPNWSSVGKAVEKLYNEIAGRP